MGNKLYEYLFKVKNGSTIPLAYIILFGVGLITTLMYFKN